MQKINMHGQKSFVELEWNLSLFIGFVYVYFQPSLPTDRLQGSRGEAILERRVPSVSPHHSLYSPDGTHSGHVTRPEHPPYQHPPAYQQPQSR